MNITTQTGNLTQERPRRHVRIPTARLPIYVRLMLLTSALMTVGVIGWTIVLRQDVEFSNPFAEYAEILPGQPRSAVIALQFSCNDTYVPVYCTHAPATGDFSLVTATLSGDVVKRVDFMVRNGALVVGELPLAWGRPHVQVYGQSVNLEWPDIGMRAGGHAQNRRFSYFVPLFRLSISASQIPTGQ